MNNDTQELTIFDMLTELMDNQTPIVNNVKKFLDASDNKDIPRIDNCATILNQKIIDIANFFKRNNLPFNVTYSKDGRSKAETDLIYAIVDELSSLNNEAINCLATIQIVLYNVAFNHQESKELYDTLIKNANRYNSLCQKMFNYELERNLPERIKMLKQEGAFTEEDMKSIQEDLQKLGLESVILELNDRLKR